MADQAIHPETRPDVEGLSEAELGLPAAVVATDETAPVAAAPVADAPVADAPAAETVAAAAVANTSDDGDEDMLEVARRIA